jgi:(p)ppGpp synthase/HD superfamily hydrolase
LKHQLRPGRPQQRDRDRQTTRAALPTFAVDLPVTQRAIRFAGHLHRNQRRASDGAPFIVHPLEVASLLHNAGCCDRVVAAGVLHDVIEKTNTTIQEIRQRFGGHVARLVSALTEDPAITDAHDRKAALRAQVHAAGDEAATIFAADKVAKVRELRMRICRLNHADLSLRADVEDKREHYIASLQMLEQLIPDHPLTRQLRFELETLQTLPPQPA